MTLKTALFLTAAVLLPVGSACAAPATPEEAHRLSDLFGRYMVKPAEGQATALSVVPSGESYQLTLDTTMLMAPFASAGITLAKTGNIVMMLTPQPDGLWHVTSDGFPSLAISKDDHTTTINYANYKFDGLFDPKLSSFKSATTTIGSSDVASLAGAAGSSSSHMGPSSTTNTSEDAGSGAVNARLQQVVKDFAYKIDLSVPSKEPDQTPVPIKADATMAGATSDISITQLPVARLLDLWAFFVAHPSKEQVIAAQGDLKTMLNAILASFPKGVAQGNLQNLVVNTSKGTFTLASAAEHLDMSGDQTNDFFGVGLKGDGLAVPKELVPAWAVGLVPTSFDINEKAGPVHVNAGLRVVVADFDLGAEKPFTDEQVSEIAQAFADLNDITVTLAPTTITTDLMSVKAQGNLKLVGGAPAGSATVSAAGLDKAIQALNAPGPKDPNQVQALQFLTGMKQLAKAEPDGSYSWLIEAAPGMPVMLNGRPMSPAGGAQHGKRKPGAKSAP